MENVALFVPTFHVDECLDEIRECLEKGWTGLGYKTNEFEKNWSEYTGLPHSHFLNSSTVGLQLAFKVFKEMYGWNSGDEVITTPLTFISTNHAILYEGLVPVFADVDNSLCLDPASVESKITPKTKAVIYVGIGGNAGQLDRIIEVCRKYNLKLILDAAHMSGTRYKGEHVGKGIDCTVFSFQAVKNLPTADSGMICFKDEAADQLVRKMSWLGINKDTFLRSKELGKGDYKWMYDVEYLGLKAHGNSVIASLGIVQLRYLDQDNLLRRKHADSYNRRLRNLTKIQIVEESENCYSSRHLYQIIVPAEVRESLIMFLNNHNIFPGVHYRSNLEYKMYAYAKGSCPKAEKASEELLSLPLHLRLTDEQINHVCDRIIEFFED